MATYLNFPIVNDVKVVSLITLLNNNLARGVIGRKHGIKDVTHLSLIQVLEQDIGLDGVGHGLKGILVFWDNLELIIRWIVNYIKSNKWPIWVVTFLTYDEASSSVIGSAEMAPRRLLPWAGFW